MPLASRIHASMDSRQSPRSNASTRTASRFGSKARRRRKPRDRNELRPPTRTSRSYGRRRRLGRTWRSSNPIVAINVRRSVASPEQELDSRRGTDDEAATVRGVRLTLDRPHGLQLPQVMVHRRLVDAKGSGEGRLREAFLPILHEEGEGVALLRRETFAVRHTEEWQRNLPVRLVVYVGRRDPFQDAHEEGRAAHEAGATRDIESELGSGGLLLPHVGAHLAGRLQEVVRVAHFDRGSCDAEAATELDDLGPGLAALRMIAVVEYDAVQVVGRAGRR